MNPPPSLPVDSTPSVSSKRGGWRKPVLITLGIVVLCCTLTALGTAWWVKHNFYAAPLRPISLNTVEHKAFEAKLAKLELAEEVAPETTPVEEEAEVDRSIKLTEREINAFLSEQGLGEQLKVSLSRNRFAANLLLPIDPDAPLFAGTTLRIRLALGALMDETGKLVVKVNDISIGGIPIPNAWLGDIKGVDLIASNLGHDPAVQRFMAGIKEFEIRDGSFWILLNE